MSYTVGFLWSVLLVLDLLVTFREKNGATGDTASGRGDIFRVHEKTNTVATIAGTDNALCAGPLTLATGVVITVSTAVHW